MTDRWLTTALAEGERSSVPVLPIGTFQTAKYGELDITPQMADEIVANWTDRVLKTDVRFDIGHDMEEAAGWIVGLSVGTYTHPKTGEEMPGIIAEVEWTPVGQKLLSEKQYRYVSSYLGSYKDEETGVVHPNVLMAVALCNDPVMRMLPPVELSDEPSGGVIVLGEVVDRMQPNTPPDPSKEAATYGLWPATSAFEDLAREAVRTLTGDALRARLAALAADLPAAIEKAVSERVAAANAEDRAEAIAEKTGSDLQADPFAFAAKTDSGDTDPVAEILAAFDAVMSKADDMCKGAAGVRAMRALATETRGKMAAILPKKGGTTDMPKPDMKMSDDAVLLAEQRDAALTELAAIKRERRVERVTASLDALSAKGMAEPSRKMLAAILLAENPSEIVLSEGAEAVDATDALLEFADSLDFVPVVTEGTAEQTPPAEEVELSDADLEVARQLGIDHEALKAAKTLKEV